MTQHKASCALATASLMSIISRGQAIQAAVICGEAPDVIESMRRQVHDQLEAYLDHTVEAATHVRNIIA